MPLTMGSRLGPYEILSAIGAGGMGEVYRARDTKLGRDVAIKVLPEAFARDSARMARFEREAKLLAALDHTNIASIYGLEDSGTTRALVMQLAEGPTLAERIRQGPLPLEDVLHIAKQIADALEYAHERGIIHRDLKPANVKVTNDDAVKVLDFGLAKALEGDPSSIDISTSPTVSRLATQAGVLLGTAAYMSPEQAKAKPVDRRADIWAFGCVLYEMLTGKQTFRGEVITDTLAAVIKEEPNWSQLPSATPMRVRVLLQRCLQKDPKERLQAIGDARIALNEVLSGAPDLALAGASQAAVPLWRRALPWAVAACLGIALGVLAFVHFRATPHVSSVSVQRFEIAAPDPSVTSVGALSPDGTRLVLVSSGANPNRLWLRRMDSLDAHPLEGTEGATGVPFWSPDSRFITFGADRKLKKIDTEGGPAQVLCDSGSLVIGGFWSPDGRIVFADPTRPPGLWEVPATGGVSAPLPGFERASSPFIIFPVLLPDGRHFLYTSGNGVMTTDVYVGLLDSKPGQQSSKKLLSAALIGFTPSSEDPTLGYLLLYRILVASTPPIATLTAQPFDLRKLELVGDPVLIAQQVSTVSQSLTGTLVYSSGVPWTGALQLTLFDRQGKTLGTVGEPGNYDSVAFSPDGKRVVAALISQPGNENLWMMDLVRGINTRFTFDSAAADIFPVWSPDGNRIAFGSTRGGVAPDLYQKLSNGGGDDELLFKTDHGVIPLSWSDDGRFLLFGGGRSGGAPVASVSDVIISVLPLDANGHAAGKPFPFGQKGVGIGERFSPGPQGRPLWVAYSSNESGRYEIYVRPFDPTSPTGIPPGGGKWQVSTQGGFSPRWNSDGKELFYVAPDGSVMSAEVTGNAVFQSGTPKPLFRPKGFSLSTTNVTFANWDVSSDGKKFIFPVLQSANTPGPPTKFTVVLNWQAALKK